MLYYFYHTNLTVNHVQSTFSSGHVRGTKTITFTLESPGEVEQEWMVRPKSSKHNNQPKKKAKRREKTGKKTEMFSAETLERLKQVCV